MESALNLEYMNLIDELSQGMENAMQLRVHICSTSPSKAQDLLLQGIISTFENALLILKWSGPTAQAQNGPPTPAAPESSLSAGMSPKNEDPNINSTVSRDHEEASKKRKLQATRTEKVRNIENVVDGFSWRKYGQKDILGAKHPRSYYRCTYRVVRNCWATKQVQRSDEDLTLVKIIYKGTHTCNHQSCAVSHNQIILEFNRAKSLTDNLNIMENPSHLSFPPTFPVTERENQCSPIPEYGMLNYPLVSNNPNISESNHLSAQTNLPLLEFPTNPIDVDLHFPFCSLDFSRD